MRDVENRGSTDGGARVCIGIPTFRRSDNLRELLRRLEVLEGEAAIRIVVSDNDPVGGEGLAVCKQVVGEGYRFSLVAIGTAEHGIAANRNAIVRAALASEDIEFLAMIDDDALPERDWLKILLEVMARFEVDVVRGAMHPLFEGQPEDWLVKTGYFQSRYTDTGRVSQIHGGGNFLIRAAAVRALGEPWFDDAYALTGGEDDDFFLRLKEDGCTFAQSHEAIVYERMPAVRCTPAWLLKRASMNGASWANIRMRRRPGGWSPWLEVAKIASGFVGGVGMMLLFFWSRHRRFQGLYRVFRAAGKVRGLLGKLRAHYPSAASAGAVSGEG